MRQNTIPQSDHREGEHSDYIIDCSDLVMKFGISMMLNGVSLKIRYRENYSTLN
ncbi:hypothetical protein [Methanocella arvoryzae]|uniref:hypothetical protein n=1 Tax=Methanocella arvoryzae TaxID=1175445 RepID=UPI000325D268|nr:hypothetical protein [Methanocella arvoryzae]